MAELGSAGVSTGLQRRYETRGEAPVFGMATELFPMVPSSDDLMDPELHFPSGSRLGWMRTTAQPNVGEFASVALTNNPDTGVIAIVQGFEIQRETAGALSIELGLEGGPLSVIAGAAGYTRDSRYGWTTARTVITGSGASNVAPNPLVLPTPQRWTFTANRAEPQLVRLSLVLAPQSRIWLMALDSNEEVRVNWWWRERKIEGGELLNTR